jgi:hypothetical protein
METWECGCGRENAAKWERCLNCGAARAEAGLRRASGERGAGEEPSGHEVLMQGAAELTERYGFPVEPQVFGGAHRLTAREAREILAETEALLREELAEGLPEELVAPGLNGTHVEA